jgi:hypothetical protein
MGNNQGDRQQTLRTSTGKALNYEGDWLAKFDANAIAAGTFNGRLLAFINAQLAPTVPYTEINGAMYAYAIAQTTTGAKSFNELGPFTIVGG